MHSSARQWTTNSRAAKPGPLLLGHRGARLGANPPENTFAAFDLALASGCDGFEFDVRLTLDREAVICHDPRVDGAEIDRCSALEAGLSPLRSVLERYRDTAFLDIELKTLGLEEIALHLLRSFPPERGFVVSSFLPTVLREIRRSDPNIPLGLICETKRQLELWPDLPIQYAILHQKLISTKLIDDLKAESKKIFLWTVNSAPRMKRFSRMEVDGIISDNPALLVRTLRQPVSHGKPDFSPPSE